MPTHGSMAETVAISLEIASMPSAASVATNGAGVDMAGWEGVLFVLNLGATDGTVDMKVQGDDAAGFGSPVDITGAAITQISATGDNRAVGIDVWRPTEKFLRAVVTTGAGAVADELGVIAIRYRRTGRAPVAQTLTELIKVAQN